MLDALFDLLGEVVLQPIFEGIVYVLSAGVLKVFEIVRKMFSIL